ncbi:MAG: histidine phosphatase family protein, partial [Actinomycetota bacterium]
LSEEGKLQAEGLAERLAVFRLKGVYSSPLERCLETAGPVAARQRLPLGLVEELGEIHYGDWQGKPYNQLYRMKRWSELQARPADFRFPNGETIREAQNRAMRAIEGVSAKHARGAVLVVSHADLIRLIIAGYLGLGIDLYQRISVGVASVSAIVLGDRVPRLLRMGDTGSLNDLAARLKIPPKPTSRKGAVRRLPSRPQASPAARDPSGAAAEASPADEEEQ